MSTTDTLLRKLHRENELLEIAMRLRIRASAMRQFADKDEDMADRLTALGNAVNGEVRTRAEVR